MTTVDAPAVHCGWQPGDLVTLDELSCGTCDYCQESQAAALAAFLTAEDEADELEDAIDSREDTL